MADVTKKYVDYAGLSKYDELIKGQILSDAANAASSAVSALDVSEFALTSVSGSILSISGIKEVDGIISAGSNSVSLAKVAMTGVAGDVAYDNTSSGLSATDVKGAIDEVAAASSGGVDSKTIYLTDNSSGQSDYAKVYKVWQGANPPDHATAPAALIGTINVPKDKVVQDGEVVDIFFDDSDNTLHEGSISGPDVTELIKGSGTATAADAGKYIKLTLQNVDDPLYIAANDLVDVYKGGTTAEATVTVSGGVITVAINNIDGAKIIYKTETSAGAGDGETVKQALTRLDGSDSTDGSVRKIAKDAATSAASDAVAALDTSSDVALYSHDTTTGAVTFTGSLAETDGIIDAGSADDVIFTPVTESEISALFVTP